MRYTFYHCTSCPPVVSPTIYPQDKLQQPPHKPLAFGSQSRWLWKILTKPDPTDWQHISDSTKILTDFLARKKMGILKSIAEVGIFIGEHGNLGVEKIQKSSKLLSYDVF